MSLLCACQWIRSDLGHVPVFVACANVRKLHLLFRCDRYKLWTVLKLPLENWKALSVNKKWLQSPSESFICSYLQPQYLLAKLLQSVKSQILKIFYKGGEFQKWIKIRIWSNSIKLHLYWEETQESIWLWMAADEYYYCTADAVHSPTTITSECIYLRWYICASNSEWDKRYVAVRKDCEQMCVRTCVPLLKLLWTSTSMCVGLCRSCVRV